ncbi:MULTISPECIES: polymer-forming cytoskeletal protein [unclassified Treponema]|jgi:cytoskeletal protein CcmA (bactofilin family)|uniref:bactofilin family protein n=1 Tax=unclassified Treponema TaxID=2638727 RepID=UPI001B0DA200|nr:MULTISPECIES: polymer-forming cytoskeletal protein [unclassified Treponema]MBO6218615.1 polymer-forming cytoskeletal protein [Treponema sp.]MBQ8678424.1 polymer-forming cytoskeletal protein [Treponema sp.]
MAFLTDDISVRTIIGLGSAISGDVHADGFIRVEGDIDGNLESTGHVDIGSEARINGNVTAQSVVLGGIVLGDIYAPNGIKLLSSSAVIGNISTKNLEIQENVIFHGHCIALKKEDEFTEAAEQFSNMQSIRSRAANKAI